MDVFVIYILKQMDVIVIYILKQMDVIVIYILKRMDVIAITDRVVPEFTFTTTLRVVLLCALLTFT